MTSLHKHPDRNAATAAVAAQIVDAVESALARGPDARARLCLSGGTSPVPLYRELATRTLRWDRVDLFLSDERWVPGDDPDSNEGLVRRELMSGPAAAATLHGLYREGQSVDAAAPAVSAELANGADAPFDYCLLGMGGDGHTASLFPDARDVAALIASPADAVAVHVARLPQPRISLTAARLLRSRRIGLLMFGNEKLTVLERALGGDDAAELPVRCIVRQRSVPVDCHWAP
jgi:6-phosphogluconolactonase